MSAGRSGVVLATVVAAMAVRVAIGVLAPADPLVNDAAGYWSLAHSLLDRGELAFHPGMPTAIRTPGYPAILAGMIATFGPSIRAVLVLHGVCAALTVWWLYRTCALLQMGTLAIWLAVGGIGFYPPMLHAIHGVYSEGVAVPLMALLLYLWARHHVSGRRVDLVGLGVAAAASTLVRPASLLLVPALAVASLGARRRLDVPGWTAALVLSLLPPAAWTARNSALGLGQGYETFSSFQAYASVLSLEPEFDAAGAVPIGDWQETCRLANRFLPERVGRPVQLPTSYPVDLGGLTELEIQRHLRARTMELVGQQPRAYLASFPRRFLILWADIGNRTYEHRLYLNAILALTIVTLVVFSFAWPATRAAPITWLGVVCFAYVTGLSLPFSVSDRYTWPSLLAMFPCATHCVTVAAARWLGPGRWST